MTAERCGRKGCPNGERYRGFCSMNCKNMQEHADETVAIIVEWLRAPTVDRDAIAERDYRDYLLDQELNGIADEIEKRWGGK